MPELLQLPMKTPYCVLACGASQKNSACLLDGDLVWHSPVHGDLSEAKNRLALIASLENLQAKASQPIQAIAHDMHPDFFSTHIALEIAAQLNVPAIGVQHHHAHIALIQAQKGIHAPVLGLALDGFGFGEDGTAWGGELFWVDGVRFERLAHLPALQMPGGDIAAREPWRMAAALLHSLGRTHEIGFRLARLGIFLNPQYMHTSKISNDQLLQRVTLMLERNIHCPSTTSAGRWFDAVAGLLGVCSRQTEEAQAAITLEALAQEWLSTHPAPLLDQELKLAGMNLHVVANRILSRLDQSANNKSLGQCAALFHVALSYGLVQEAINAARKRNVTALALGGGCFFNNVLRKLVVELARSADLEILLPDNLNVGDAGLPLGQAWLAGKLIHKGGCEHLPIDGEYICA